MADTPSTGNTTQTVDPATPTTTEESSEKAVQLAAAAVVQVASPGRGAEASVIVEAGLTYELVDPVVRFTQDGGDLVVHWRDGGHTTLEDYLVLAQADLPPALTLADGTVISFDQLVASIEGFDLGAIAPAAVAPAAGLPAPAAAGGAFNTPFDGGDIGEGPGITDLLLNTELQFGLLEFLDEVFGEEEAVTITVDDVTISGIGMEGSDEVVDEDDLADGSSPNASALTQTGTFDISAPDGFDDLTIGGTLVVTDGVVTLPGSPIVTTYGELTITDVNLATGVVSYSYTLTDNTLDHGPGDNGENDVFDEIAVHLTDTDGDFADSTLIVKVIDDVPTAADDADSVTEDGPTVATGNVITAVDPGPDANSTDGVADTAGADGIASIAWTGEADDEVAGLYGTLTVDANGNYSYALNNGLAAVQGLTTGEFLLDTFDYTITDGDGDTSPATLTITINGADDGVTISGIGLEGGDEVVDEDDLADGSSPNASALTQTGTFDISAPDGFDDLTIGGTLVVTDGVVTLPGSPIVTTYGELTITDVNLATGVVSYSYTLTDNTLDHGPGDNGENDVFDNIAVHLTDTDGDFADSTLIIKVIDDIPVINSITDAIVVNQPVQVVNGTYDASVGADELDFLGLVLRDNADYEIIGDVNGVTQVDVTVNGTSFSFFFTVTENKVSDEGDGSVEFEAFFDTAKTDPFFTLTVNPDGTYVFELFDNTLLAEIVLSGNDFGGGAPVEELNVDSILTLTARTDGTPGLINPSNQGLAVGTDQNMDTGEAIIFAFASPQTEVSFNLTKWTGGAGTVTITLRFGGIIGTAVLEIDSTSGSNFRTVQIIQDPNLTLNTFFVDDANDTVFVNFEFSELDVEYTSSTSETIGFNIDNLGFDAEVTIEGMDLDFGLSVTDMDGDTDTLDDNLTIELVGNGVEDGLTLTGSTEGEILVGGTGPDTIDGGEGNDILIGNGGDDELTGGAGDDTFVYTSGADGNDTILDYAIADDTVDLEALFNALQALENDDFDTEAERLAALEYSDAGGGELLLTIDDGTGGADTATDNFSITFDNLLFTDFDTQGEQDALEATFILGGL